jgi:hypothetical protein
MANSPEHDEPAAEHRPDAPVPVVSASEAASSAAAAGQPLTPEPWAVNIVHDHFAEGIKRICDSKFLARRYEEFQRKNDPIYAELLGSMHDKPLAKTFVSYWTIAQTLATRSRFWLEAAVADIILHQVEHAGRAATEVYSHAMLGQGFPRARTPVQEMPKRRVERVADGTPWRVRLQRHAMDTIDGLVGKQERYERPARHGPHKRAWSGANGQARQRDEEQLTQVAASLRGPPADPTTLQCNLLVVEPDRAGGPPHAWAIRFINPKTFTQHAARKQERVNLLRLYALLVQDRVMPAPQSIHVCVAELVPRGTGWDDQDHYPDYFSSLTYWSNKRLWEFIGVPFDTVKVAIREVAAQFREQLRYGLRRLLPGMEKAEMGSLWPTLEPAMKNNPPRSS